MPTILAQLTACGPDKWNIWPNEFLAPNQSLIFVQKCKKGDIIVKSDPNQGDTFDFQFLFTCDAHIWLLKSSLTFKSRTFHKQFCASFPDYILLNYTLRTLRATRGSNWNNVYKGRVPKLTSTVSVQTNGHFFKVYFDFC